MVESIVERLKIEDDSLNNSQTQNTNKIQAKVIEDGHTLQLIKIQSNVKEMKN
jgi:hypothetical protein